MIYKCKQNFIHRVYAIYSRVNKYTNAYAFYISLINVSLIMFKVYGIFNNSIK